MQQKFSKFVDRILKFVLSLYFPPVTPPCAEQRRKEREAHERAIARANAMLRDMEKSIAEMVKKSGVDTQ